MGIQRPEARDQKENDSSNSPFTIHSSPFSPSLSVLSVQFVVKNSSSSSSKSKINNPQLVRRSLGEVGSSIVNQSSEHLPAFIPTSYLSDAKLRINSYRELAEANTSKAIDSLEKNWIDRHGRLPEPVNHLLTIARIKAEAAANNVSSVEISGQRLMLQRNGSPILLDGSRYPRLMKTQPGEKLDETLEMLKNFGVGTSPSLKFKVASPPPV